MTKIPSPVGPLTLVASNLGLHALLFDCEVTLTGSDSHPVLREAARQLQEYFAGLRRDFDLPLVPKGTKFQMKAWRELRQIPFGQTISYGEQAKRLGSAKATRAVGTANSRNPIAIVIPCHRVIAGSGALSGFGGGVDRKRFLLELESSGRP